MQYKIIKKNTLYYITRTSRAPGECKRVRASAVAAARATPPRLHRHRRRRRHNLILSVTRVARRRYCPSGVRPLNGFINTHIIHDVLFIRVCIHIHRYMHTTVVVVIVFVTIIITITFVKIDDRGPSTTHPFSNIPRFFSRVSRSRAVYRLIITYL